MIKVNVSNEEALTLFIELPDLFYIDSERVKEFLIGIGIGEDKILAESDN